jgi:hypothetical protein
MFCITSLYENKDKLKKNKKEICQRYILITNVKIDIAYEYYTFFFYFTYHT